MSLRNNTECRATALEISGRLHPFGNKCLMQQKFDYGSPYNLITFPFYLPTFFDIRSYIDSFLIIHSNHNLQLTNYLCDRNLKSFLHETKRHFSFTPLENFYHSSFHSHPILVCGKKKCYLKSEKKQQQHQNRFGLINGKFMRLQKMLLLCFSSLRGFGFALVLLFVRNLI